MDNEVIQVDITKLRIEEKSWHKEFDEKAIAELAESISEHGCLTPILARREGDEYIIAAGERRWRACQIAGLETVPVIISSFDE